MSQLNVKNKTDYLSSLMKKKKGIINLLLVSKTDYWIVLFSLSNNYIGI